MNRQELAERQKTISRNHWMFRLYKFTWGKDANYEGFCPLFWVSAFNLSIIPLTLAGKVFEGAWDIAANLVPEKSKQEPKDPIPLKPTDRQIVMLFEENLDRLTICDYNWGAYLRINLWLELNPNWRDLFYPDAKTRVEEENKKIREQEEREKARRARLDKQIEKITAWAQYLVKPALLVSALAAGYAVYWTIGFLISNITLSFVVGVLKILGAISLIVFLGWAGFRIAESAHKILKFEKKLSEPEKPEEPSIFSKTRFAIGEGIEFVLNAIDIIYKKKCPLIVLTEDETRPIEKINKSE